MTTEIVKKIRVAADCLAGEEAGQFAEEDGFRLVAWRIRFAHRSGSGRQRLGAQGFAIDLARGQARHFGQHLVMHRHHVGWQFAGQGGAQGAGGRGSGAIRHDIGDQSLEIGVLAEQDGGGADTRLAAEGGLNFAQFDPETADFHLVVGAAEAMDAPLGINPRQVAGAIQPAMTRVLRPGIGQELLGGQFRAAKVAGGNTRAANAQLAGFALGQQTQAGFNGRVDDQQAVIGQRLANGHRLAATQLGQAGRDGGFGRAVGVEDLATGARPTLDQRRRAGFAAEIDQAQVGDVAAEQGEQGGNRVQHADLLFDQGLRQGLGIRGDFARRNPQTGADQIADPDFLEGHVEGDRKALINPVIFANAEDGIFAAQKMADGALVDLDAFRLAGRARGIDDVGGILRADALPAQRRPFQWRDQLLGQPPWSDDVGQTLRFFGTTEQADGICIGQADGDPVDRYFGVKGQPGGAGLGDAQLHDQQVDAARHPQADDLPWANAGSEQTAGDPVGQGVEFAIA